MGSDYAQGFADGRAGKRPRPFPNEQYLRGYAAGRSGRTGVKDA